jgi:hypothetical protein
LLRTSCQRSLWQRIPQTFFDMMEAARSQESFGRFPRSGLFANGTPYQLPQLVPPINEIEYGLFVHEVECCMDMDCTCRPKRMKCPTPTAGDAKSSGSRNLAGSKAHAGVSLTDFVRFGNSQTAREGQTTGGSLNPTWVEWLMGFPSGWTDCDASETQSCRKSPK